MAETEETKLEALEVFKKSLEDASREVQIDCINNLSRLASLMGVEKTRNQLLPYVIENIEWHDEILVKLSSQLRNFIPLVGGYDHAKIVLDFLSKLCAIDETMVRDEALETAKSICEHLSDQQCDELFLPFIKGLANEDWFTSKCSAAALFAVCYPKISDDKKLEVRNLTRSLIQDESPVIRKSLATSLVDLLEVLEVQFILSDFLPVFDNVANDPIDSVRVVSVDLAITIAKKLKEVEVEKYIFPTMEKWCDDPSWRMRQILAYRIQDIQNIISYEKTRNKILVMYEKLAQDIEAEVRTVAVDNMFKFCKSLKKSCDSSDKFELIFEESIMPLILFIIKDPNELVRLALSNIIMSFGFILSKDSFSVQVLPEIINVLETEKSMPFQKNILENLNFLPEDINITQSLPSIVKVIRSIIMNAQRHWRTRRSVILAFMYITKFTSLEYFVDNLRLFYLCLVGDPIFAIRRTSPVILPLLAKQYGIQCITTCLAPYFLSYKIDCRYLYRHIPLFCIDEIINPTLHDDKDTKYLHDLKELTTNSETKKQASRVLAKLSKLLEKVKSKEIEETHDLIKEEEVDLVKDDIKIYAEETLDALKNNYNISNIFSIELVEIERNQCTYLEGVLVLLHKEFLHTSATLAIDPIENIQVRATKTLQTIKNFLRKLEKEFKEPWVEEAVKEITSEELEVIEKEIESELSKHKPKVEDHTLDFDWMDSLTINGEDLPDLGGEIPELEMDGDKHEIDEVAADTEMSNGA